MWNLSCHILLLYQKQLSPNSASYCWQINYKFKKQPLFHVIVICRNNLDVSYPQIIFFLLKILSKSSYFGIKREYHSLNSGSSKQKYKKGLIQDGTASISNWEGPHFDFCPPAPPLNQKPKQNIWSCLGSINVLKRMNP